MNDTEIKLVELKLKNFISIRQILASALIVLIGGLVSLAFSVNSFLKYFFIIFGFLYVVVLARSLHKNEVTLAKLFKKEKKD